MPSEFFDLGNRSSNTTKENISSVSEFFDLPISESTVQADIAHALSLEGELGLEPGALSGNAPNSNLQPFDVKVPSGTTPEKMTKDIVTSKTIPSSGCLNQILTMKLFVNTTKQIRVSLLYL